MASHITNNHEIWHTCPRCGYEFDARVWGYTCPRCAAKVVRDIKNQKTGWK